MHCVAAHLIACVKFVHLLHVSLEHNLKIYEVIKRCENTNKKEKVNMKRNNLQYLQHFQPA